MKYVIAVLLSLVSLEANATRLDLSILLDDKTCLKMNMYHEARGESYEGLIKVMQVTLARVMSPEFPNTICDVVWQKNQFSWTNDSRKDNVILDLVGWNQVNDIVESYFNGELSIDLRSSRNILYYHANSIEKPKWFKKANLQEIKKIGRHIFYKK